MKHSSLLAAYLLATLPRKHIKKQKDRKSLAELPPNKETIAKRLNKAEKKRLKRQNRNLKLKLGETK
jgi:hypothetical protein